MARQQAGIAREKTEESRLRLVGSNLATGDRAVESGDYFGALPAYAEALPLDRGHPEREAMHRTRLGALLRYSPHLTRLWFHGGPVNAAAFSRDGKRAATASSDGTARVYDTATSAQISPDGASVVTASEDSVVHVWDSRSGAERQRRRFNGPVLNAEFSPDGKRIAVADVRAPAEVRDLRADTVLTVQDAPQDTVLDVAFSPGGDRVAAATTGWRAVAWDAHTGAESGRVHHDDYAVRVVFSPDGQRLASVGLDNTARVLDLRSGPLTPPMRHGGRSGPSPSARTAASC